MHKNQLGISLLESLIAILVLSIGLLGVAGLQTQSLIHNRAAYFETQATNMAQDMLDRIRANSDNASTYSLGVGSEVSGSSLSAADRSEWVEDLATTLPSGEGGISISSNRMRVTVRWADTSAPDDVRQIELVSEL
ncbi:type IV pilus modification protein PilV [Halomonas sp. M1]|uniref:type IV pilus modification protein PilV n=1 Tax=Halomonas sp. M1 TaxID=3035470 RepID=UPI00248609F5|nr:MULTISPECIES: type IV pilus modification protein PilV [unclassified Halomonas]MDP3535829.1 type IV pilus modification protein PilV [Halomonas sp.]WFE69974.1 type IV pilus modification protein PilV [Halomonas sp. M1]